MDTITVSPELQVVIPCRICEKLNLKPGDKLQIISINGRIELIRLRPMKEMRGFLKGYDPIFEREEEDRI